MNSRRWRGFLVPITIFLALAGCNARTLRKDALPSGGPTAQTPAGAQAGAPSTGAPATGTEELWVIAKPTDLEALEPSNTAMLPYLRRSSERETEKVRLPLQHTDVRAVVAGCVATVNVQQQYLNPFTDKIDVEYVFPLPHNAAVSDFLMTIGARHIRGIIRARDEAQRIYGEASRAGRVVSLLTQQGPNFFTQAVANIDPGKEIDIDITYFHTLAYHDGEYELFFPMLVAPHNNPQRAGQDIAITVDIDAGMRIESVHSPSHAVSVRRPSDDSAHVELERLDQLTDRDFVLRFKTAGDDVKTGLLAHRDQRGGFFTLLLQAPAAARRLPALTDVEVDWGGLEVSDVYPKRIPDLIVGRPLVLSGRFRNPAPASIQISGRAGGQRHTYRLSVSRAELSEHHPALPSVWARAHIADLESQVLAGEESSEQRRKQIADIALEYGVVSSETAFLAVDASSPGSAGDRAPIDEPVPAR